MFVKLVKLKYALAVPMPKSHAPPAKSKRCICGSGLRNATLFATVQPQLPEYAFGPRNLKACDTRSDPDHVLCQAEKRIVRQMKMKL